MFNYFSIGEPVTNFDLVASVIRKYKKAIEGLKDSKADFEGLSAQRAPEELKVWMEEAEQADLNRAEDVNAMDIYETKQQKGWHSDIEDTSYSIPSAAPTKADIQIMLSDEELKSRKQTGVTSWLASGIRIQDRQ